MDKFYKLGVGDYKMKRETRRGKKAGSLLFLFSLGFILISLSGIVSAWGTTCMKTQPQIEWNAVYSSSTQQFTVNYREIYCLRPDDIYTCGEDLDYALHGINNNFCATISNGAGGTGNNIWLYTCVGDSTKCCGSSSFQNCQNNINSNWGGSWKYSCYGNRVGISPCTGGKIPDGDTSVNFNRTVRAPFASSSSLSQCTTSPYNGKGYQTDWKSISIAKGQFSGKMIAAYSFYHGDDTHCDRTRVTQLGIAKLPDCNYDSAGGYFYGECCSDSRVTGIDCNTPPLPSPCALNQTIMKLSSLNDSHGALWNYTGETTTISTNVTTCPLGLAGYWKFDEDSGDVAVDSAGGNNGTLINSPTRTTGKLGNALQFDGVDDYVDTKKALISNSEVTICAWIYPIGWGGDSRGRILDNVNAYFYVNNNNAPRQALSFSSDADKYSASSGNSISLNAWKFVCITRPSTVTPAYYINGIVSPLGINGGGSLTAAITDATIGGRRTADRTFNGKIDEVSVFNRILSAVEVSDLYNSSNGKSVCNTTVQVSTVTTPGYDYSICYPDIFGEDYTGANPHACVGGNKVLGLSSVSDAHAEVPELNNYRTSICYGDLVCGSDNACIPDEEIVASLYSETNSHVAAGDFPGYDIKICCRKGVSSSLSNLHWENMNGESIDATRIGASVKAVVPGSELAGKNISYKIWKSVAWWWDDKVAISSTRGDLIWKAGKNKSSGILEGGDYYFEAKVGTGSFVSSEGNAYGTLRVAPGNNVPPVANITSPKDKQIYFLNEPLSFTQASYDVDSTFNWVWDFGDESSVSGDSVSMNNYNVVHAYTTTGQKNIKLNVVDEEGASSMDKVTILVVNSSYILAYIDEPKWGSSAFTSLVKCNATSTYAVNVTHNSTGIEKIECIAGNCPSKTEGCPPPFTNYPDCQIQVRNPDNSLPPNSAGFENVDFYWVFDNNPLKNQTGKGTENALFYKMFEPGVHTAKLTAKI